METNQNFIKELYNDYKKSISDFKGKPYKHIPNILSFSRLLILPVIAASAYMGEMLLTASLVAGSFITDAIDGKLAKKLNAFSDLGRKLDPFADKMLVGISGIIVASLAPIFIIPMSLMLGYELAITKVNHDIFKMDKTRKASEKGRMKQVALAMTIVSTLLYLANPTTLCAAITALGTFVTVVKQNEALKDYKHIRHLVRREFEKPAYFKSEQRFGHVRSQEEQYVIASNVMKKIGCECDLNPDQVKHCGKDNVQSILHEKKRTCASLIDGNYKEGNPKVRKLLKNDK